MTFDLMLGYFCALNCKLPSWSRSNPQFLEPTIPCKIVELKHASLYENARELRDLLSPDPRMQLKYS